jgi:two-component system NarL family response regulator
MADQPLGPDDKGDGKIRVIIADDHPIVRMGLRALIDAQPDMRIVAEADGGAAAVAAFTTHRPDVMLVDLRMPGMGGREVISAVRTAVPDARIIVLTSFDGDEDVFRAVQAGARGYLLKASPPDEVVKAVRTVHAGGRLISPDVAARLADRVNSPSLTAREVAVLELVAKGLSNKEIAAALFLAEDTVKNHLKHVFAKLEVSDRTEAVLLAVQRGIITLG